MEKIQYQDMKMLIDVLNQGNDHIMELEAHLDNQHNFSSETCLILSSKVQSTFSTAINMTKLIEQRSCSHSCERSFKEIERREMCKKRKSLPRWSGQVQACSASAMEIAIDDGHNWRKYGQKDILGAKFPRCYYRCTHRHSHGCLATKHVQRSDENNFIFNITYRGAHTCNNGFHNPLMSTEEHIIHQNQSFKVKNEALSSTDHKPDSSSSFSFPLTSEICLKPENRVLSSASNTAIADIICASSSNESSQMLGMEFGVEQFVFDNEFSFDFY